MSRKILKRCFCVILSFLFMFNMVYNHSLTVLAEEGGPNENGRSLRTETAAAGDQPDGAGNTEETQPGGETETRPEEENPTQPGGETETQPEEENLTQPGGETETQPEENPTQPGGETETQPEENPTQPGGETETHPEEENPTQPGEESETHPGEENPTQPGGETETQPEESPTQPGGENETQPEDPTQPGAADSDEIPQGNQMIEEGQSDQIQLPQDVPEQPDESKQPDKPKDQAQQPENRRQSRQAREIQERRMVPKEVPADRAVSYTSYVYVDGMYGSDLNNGSSTADAVKSFRRVVELLEENRDQHLNIAVCGTIRASGEETWEMPDSFDWNPIMIREISFKMELVSVSGSLTLKNIVLDGNAGVSAERAVVRVDGGGNLTMKPGSVIRNNRNEGVSSDGDKVGGGICVREEGNVLIDGGEVTGNQNASGGGIESFGYLTLRDGVISGNSSKFGGGVHTSSLLGGIFRMEGGTISNNSASRSGGGVCVNGHKVSGTGGTEEVPFYMSGGAISANAAECGGGIELFSQNELNCIAEISGGSISNNTAAEAGGGIFSRSTGVAFVGNWKFQGGGISNNTARIGGGIALHRSNLNMTGGEIAFNQATRQGGGIWTDSNDDKLALSGGRIHENQSSKGAGIGIGNLLAPSYSSDEYPDIFPVTDYIRLRLAEGILDESQSIALGDGRAADGTAAMYHIRLEQALENTARYKIELDSGQAANGSLIAEPDGTNVADASEYLENFSLVPGSGYGLAKQGTNIVLGQIYFVDGVNGDDSNTGLNPPAAFLTMEKAITALGANPGCIYICGTVTVPGTQTWTLGEGQSVIRYTGEAVDGGTYPAFLETMVDIQPAGVLTLSNVFLHNGTADTKTGYMVSQGGELKVNPDTVLSGGTVYLKDEKIIEVTGDYPPLIAEVEKESPNVGDVIAVYTGAGENQAKTANFSLAEPMSDFRLGLDGTSKVILAGSVIVYIDGVDGDDTNSGQAPDQSVLTLKRAYEILKNFGGKIMVVNTVTVGQGMQIGPVSYQGSNPSDQTAVKEDQVTVSRYEENKNPLFLVEKGRFTLDGIKVDGGFYAENAAPLIQVKGEGTLAVQNKALLQNNKNSAGNGGAIGNDGTVLLYECTLAGNEAAKGSAVCQNGILKICSEKAELSDGEIYFGTGKYINIEVPLSSGRMFRINMDSGDTPNGRVVAVFAKGAWNPGGVSLDAGHFRIDPAATNKVLTSQGADTLVLGSTFGVILNREEVLGEIGTQVGINAMFSFADPSDVAAEAWKDGKQITIEDTDEGWCRSIKIPVTKENTGEITLKFSHQNAVLEKTVVMSSCAVSYEKGRDCLTAEAQSDLIGGLHQDKAYITVYNGNSEDRTLKLKNARVSYEDQAECFIDNQKVSRDMEPESAMKYFGFTLRGNQNVEAEGTVRVQAVLSNADRLNAEKKGTLLLEGLMLGDAQTDLSIPYQTKPYTRAEVTVAKDRAGCASQKIELQKVQAGAEERIPLTELAAFRSGGISGTASLSRAQAGLYRLTGIGEGTYQVYVNGINTHKSLTVTAGNTGEARVDLYSIRYELNGGTVKGELPENYIQGIGAKLKDPVRKNCVFQGWYTDSSFAGEKMVSVSKEFSGSLSLYAKWKEKKEPGGTVQKPQTPPTAQTPQDITKKVGDVPKTGDKTVRIITEVALVGGLAYLMKMFTDPNVQVGMTEEKKNSLMKKLIGAARGKNPLIRLGALAVIFILLLFYHTIGKSRMQGESAEVLKPGVK